MKSIIMKSMKDLWKISETSMKSDVELKHDDNIFYVGLWELKKDQLRYLRRNWRTNFTDPHFKGAPHFKGDIPE